MWQLSLRIWKLSTLGSPHLFIPTSVIVILLTPLTAVPGLSLLVLVVIYYITLSYTVFVSKKTIESEAEIEELSKFLRTNVVVVFTKHSSETVSIMLAQSLLYLFAILLAVLILTAGGVWTTLKLFVHGGEFSWQALVWSILIALFVYVSIVTSFPIFFGRAMLRGRGFWSTLRTFISSLYTEVSWKMLLSWDYISSSVVISLTSLGFVLLNTLLLITPLGVLVSPIITFLLVHMLYIFGTVACLKLLRS